jgi:hypothetical protein
MDLQQLCRLHALQCFRWAAKIDDVTQHLIFTHTARQWLEIADTVALDPENGNIVIRSRLH